MGPGAEGGGFLSPSAQAGEKTRFLGASSVGAADRQDPHGMGLQLLQAIWGVPQGGGGGRDPCPSACPERLSAGGRGE